MIGITLATLASLTTPQVANTYYPILEKELAPAGIDTCREQCAFLAELINEGLTRSSENLYYTAARLNQVFPYYFPTVESARDFEKNPQKLANKVYGGRMGNNKINDGWLYRGRGPIGLTGRDNYRICGESIGADLVAHPELLEQPLWGVKSAIWFWNFKKLNPEAEAGNIDRISRAINTGNINSKTPAINEASRHKLYEKLLTLWKA